MSDRGPTAPDDQLHGQGLVDLDERACWDFLERHRLGRVAFVRRHRPLVFPVNYAVHDGSVVFRSAPGSKLGAALHGALAAFEVDEVDERFELGASVIVHGRAMEVTEPEERAHLASQVVRAWAPGDRDHVIRIRTHWITGRRIERH